MNQKQSEAVKFIQSVHTYSGIKEPSPNFCGECGEYLTHEVHLRVGENKQAAGERILAALLEAREV